MKLYVIYGGKSAEHDVSVKSALSIFQNIYYDYYTVIPVYITHEGNWYKGAEVESRESIISKDELVNIEEKLPFLFNELTEGESVAFPVLHGPNGEDGTIQGLFETLNIPYVGAGVLSSAVGMDKVLSKVIFKEAGLPVLPYKEVKVRDWRVNQEEVCETIEMEIDYPMYVKPVNLGSSVGITRTLNKEELIQAIELAFNYDYRVVVEKGVQVREIEVAILGNEDVHTSVPGELVKQKDFYAYEDKYLNQKVVREVPADLSPELTKKVRKMAVEAFEAINGSGISRADFFLTEDGEVYINEVNTFPGFTSHSMYPRVWAKTGLPYDDLIEEVIQLGIRRYNDKYKLSTKITRDDERVEMESTNVEMDTL
ncbi:D-alanine--D-alanine ligase family protein [Alkalibacterium sp. 20]|uniref:D-alanine--D-alanine ligase family protein n=1 Tax=Alkalibacterium sp. 20 TaxID=1798803 RepID=UPI0008FFF620|nr:D-alanine--D-alanine ligase family protein [Alkalibacterium sp. 20]